MKQTIILAGIALLFAASCSNDSDVKVNNDELVPVRVRVEGFSVSMEEFPETRATAVNSYNDANAVTVAFYKGDGTEVEKITQLKSDGSTYTTFGEFECSLPWAPTRWWLWLTTIVMPVRSSSPVLPQLPSLALVPTRPLRQLRP